MLKTGARPALFMIVVALGPPTVPAMVSSTRCTYRAINEHMREFKGKRGCSGGPENAKLHSSWRIRLHVRSGI